MMNLPFYKEEEFAFYLLYQYLLMHYYPALHVNRRKKDSQKNLK